MCVCFKPEFMIEFFLKCGLPCQVWCWATTPATTFSTQFHDNYHFLVGRAEQSRGQLAADGFTVTAYGKMATLKKSASYSDSFAQDPHRIRLSTSAAEKKERSWTLFQLGKIRFMAYIRGM